MADDLAATRRSARRITLVAGAIGVIAVLVWVAVFSSVLGAKRVVVHGADAESVARIQSVAEVPHGRSLLRLDTGEARTARESVHIYEPAEFEAMAARGGLRLRKALGHYDGSAFDAESPRWIALFEKS